MGDPWEHRRNKFKMAAGSFTPKARDEIRCALRARAVALRSAGGGGEEAALFCESLARDFEHADIEFVLGRRVKPPKKVKPHHYAMNAERTLSVLHYALRRADCKECALIRKQRAELRTTRTVVKSWPEALDALAGRRYMLDDEAGYIRVHRDARQRFVVTHDSDDTASARLRQSVILKILADLNIVIEP